MGSATSSTKPILVLGGTGKTGRRILQRLQRRGIATRSGSRSGRPPFDWQDSSTWAAALNGARAVYVSYYPDLSTPGAVAAVGAFADVAMARGVPRLVLLSGRGERAAEIAEDAVRVSGADLTILRSTWFSQNFSEDYILDHIVRGEVALPAGDTPEPFVDADDVADVAVEALIDDRHIGMLYELTGPRLLTFAEAVDEIARAAHRPIKYKPISVKQHAIVAAAQGVPVEVIDLLTYLYSEVLDGRNAHVANGVQRALGRAPRDFAEYARDAAATGVWSSI
jgi:uncharacterized protein YbjT (DUF2867 family)